MERWVSQKNIERLREQLVAASSEHDRQLLADLLAEQKRKLEQLTSDAKANKKSRDTE